MSSLGTSWSLMLSVLSAPAEVSTVLLGCWSTVIKGCYCLFPSTRLFTCHGFPHFIYASSRYTRATLLLLGHARLSEAMSALDRQIMKSFLPLSDQALSAPTQLRLCFENKTWVPFILISHKHIWKIFHFLWAWTNARHVPISPGPSTVLPHCSLSKSLSTTNLGIYLVLDCVRWWWLGGREEILLLLKIFSSKSFFCVVFSHPWVSEDSVASLLKLKKGQGRKANSKRKATMETIGCYSNRNAMYARKHAHFPFKKTSLWLLKHLELLKLIY